MNIIERLIGRREFLGVAAVTPLAFTAAGNFAVPTRMNAQIPNGNVPVPSSLEELRARLNASLKMFRQELADDPKRGNVKAYCHIETIMQKLLETTYFSPYHVFSPMPDAAQTLTAALDRLNQVIWLLTGQLPENDFKPMFHVRPYHPPWLIYMFDEEFEPESQNRMNDVIIRMKANLDIDVEIIRGLDDVCATCFITDVNRCVKDTNEQKKWDGINDRILIKQGLSYGRRLSVRELMKNTIKTLPCADDTCGVFMEKRAEQYERGLQNWIKLIG
ncbi:MAG: hypothetical protein ABIH24_05135 [Verrucomicrobiota bacterium]